MAMKGMTMSILGMGLLIIAGIIIYVFFHPLSTPNSAEYAKTDIYVMTNAVDSAKVYMEASLDYSVYQAMYDVAKRGGLGDATNVATLANALEPTVGCAKTEQRIGAEELFGCVPGKFSCGSEEGAAQNTNEGYGIGLLQFLLKKLDYKVATVDCKFGIATFRDLKEFQKNNGLEETGLVDQPTVDKLREAFAYDNCGDFFYGCSNSFSVYLDIPVSGESFESALKTELLKDINAYTSKDYMFLDLPLVTLPRYTEENMELVDEVDGVKVSLSEKNLKITKRDDEGETVYLESPFSVTKIYDIDIFGIYEKAKEELEYVKGKGCEDIAAEKKSEEGFNTAISVVTKTFGPPCEATVKVSVIEADSREFPVFDGAEASFEPVAFEFLVKVA